MIAVILLGLLACASAAPWHNHRHYRGNSHYEEDDDYLDSFFENQMFDTRRFWNEISREMLRLDSMLADLSKHFPHQYPTVEVNDKEYKITLNLPGFDEKEVVVKAKKGLLVVQAVHKEGDVPERNYLIVRSLPDDVGENGSWTYENGVLRVIFPISKNVTDITAKDVTDVPTQTVAPEHSREEMENAGENKDLNEDIDEIKPDSNRNDLITNEIPHQENTVEATTYAVGLNDDVELLPMQRY
ncbi:uncharacterized protein LOC116771374 [Danaus plexippus]|uniref:uncharacterized protein LOC116771374 n=1 Tax=Danaus plexippus TaxID=13037 RepID=UPI000239E97B|nr:uncharacterized protein LOC116771374 [Danaus plexippus]